MVELKSNFLPSQNQLFLVSHSSPCTLNANKLCWPRPSLLLSDEQLLFTLGRETGYTITLLGMRFAKIS